MSTGWSNQLGTKLGGLLAVLLATAGLVSCGRAEPTSEGTSPETVGPVDVDAVATRDPAQRYRVGALVLETPIQPTTLCIGPILASDPPAGCTGLPIDGWDWSTAPGATDQSGIRQAHVEVTGTTDGTRFRQTEPPTVLGTPVAPDPSDQATPCPTPPGGWAVTDPSRVTTADWQATIEAVAAQPDLVDQWIVYAAAQPGGAASASTGRTHESTLPNETFTAGTESILVVRFSADVERHERDLRSLWGGPLCVAQRPAHRWTGIEAQALLMSEEARAAGVWILFGSFPADQRGRVEANAVVLDDVTRRWVDDHLGAGEIVLHGLLTPVDR
jgi:hypothetical protein